MLQTVLFEKAARDAFEQGRIATDNSELPQAMVHALKMFSAFEQFPAIDADHLIDTVGKKKTPVVWRDCDF
jgi:hypothetical protein